MFCQESPYSAQEAVRQRAKAPPDDETCRHALGDWARGRYGVQAGQTAVLVRVQIVQPMVLCAGEGYGFSSKPTEPGWGSDRIARTWAELMKRLGYTRYVAQGGDWSSPVCNALARQAPSGLLGVHVNLPATVPPEVVAALASGGPAPADLSAKEHATFDALSAATKAGDRSYRVVMSARPPTIGYASPTLRLGSPRLPGNPG